MSFLRWQNLRNLAVSRIHLLYKITLEDREIQTLRQISHKSYIALTFTLSMGDRIDLTLRWWDLRNVDCWVKTVLCGFWLLERRVDCGKDRR